MTLSNISVSIHSPSCSSVGTQCSPPPVYENLENYGCYADCSLKSACSHSNGQYQPVCTVNDNPIYKGTTPTNDTYDPSLSSSDGSHRLKYDTMETSM
ncbi:unnamed protein product [Enterobius vermicularis]|uniref:EB domain-containing protein n=1 Tax=Enterobius vermicularis TaxID=51028 RepID=A0A0N4VGM8_ENTVE|nr:unnamed protein product [Enterobius vermicularis]